MEGGVYSSNLHAGWLRRVLERVGRCMLLSYINTVSKRTRSPILKTYRSPNPKTATKPHFVCLGSFSVPIIPTGSSITQRSKKTSVPVCI